MDAQLRQDIIDRLTNQVRPIRPGLNTLEIRIQWATQFVDGFLTNVRRSVAAGQAHRARMVTESMYFRLLTSQQQRQVAAWLGV